jgi:hypothetical protein
VIALVRTNPAAFSTPGYVATLLVLYDRVDGLAMLRMMGGSPASHDHDHIDALASRTD